MRVTSMFVNVHLRSSPTVDLPLFTLKLRADYCVPGRGQHESTCESRRRRASTLLRVACVCECIYAPCRTLWSVASRFCGHSRAATSQDTTAATAANRVNRPVAHNCGLPSTPQWTISSSACCRTVPAPVGVEPPLWLLGVSPRSCQQGV